MSPEMQAWLANNHVKKCPTADKRYNRNEDPYFIYAAQMQGRPNSAFHSRKRGLNPRHKIENFAPRLNRFAADKNEERGYKDATRARGSRPGEISTMIYE